MTTIPPSLGLQRSKSFEPRRRRSDPHEKAATTIQRYVRNSAAVRRSRWLRSLWPSLKRIREKIGEELQAKYLDDDAVSAGARGTKMYTDEYLLMRESCRSDKLVKMALETAWSACSQGEATLSKTQYMSMARRVFLAILLDSDSEAAKSTQRISATKCIRSSEKDFTRDAKGKDHLTQDDFYSSWFELADLHTEGVGARLYASFILGLADKIARRVRLHGRYEWRDDRAIFAEASVSCSALGKARKQRSPTAPAVAGKGAVAAVTKTAGSKSANGKENASPTGNRAPQSSNNNSAAQGRASPNQSGQVWTRLAWLTAFDAARRAEQEVENERRRIELERQQTAATAPAAAAAAPAGTTPQAAYTALKALSAIRARPHSRLLSQQLSSASSATGLRSLSLGNARPRASSLPLADASAVPRGFPLSGSGSLATALHHARAEATSDATHAPLKPKTTNSLPPLVMREKLDSPSTGSGGLRAVRAARARAFSQDSVAQLLSCPARLDAVGSPCPSPCPSPCSVLLPVAPACASPVATSPRSKANRCAPPPLARLVSGEQLAA